MAWIREISLLRSACVLPSLETFSPSPCFGCFLIRTGDVCKPIMVAHRDGFCNDACSKPQKQHFNGAYGAVGGITSSRPRSRFAQSIFFVGRQIQLAA